MEKLERSGAFLPYYINQERLFDLHAVLNGGYSEYEEILSFESQEKRKNGTAKVAGNGGFRLFKVSGSISGGIGQSASDGMSVKTHLVQTPASMLDLVIRELEQRNLIWKSESLEEGSFVLIPVRLKINSIKSLIEEAKDLVVLSQKMTSLGEQKGKNKSSQNEALKQIQQISGITKELFDAEEIVCEKSNYAIVGTISDVHLYQSSRIDIVDTELMCLAQVKRVFSHGTQLMKNTVFARIQDAASKRDLINSLTQIRKEGNFEYSSEAIPEIVDKPVYELDVIALYHDAPSNSVSNS